MHILDCFENLPTLAHRAHTTQILIQEVLDCEYKTKMAVLDN
jgi:hypothetical protein